MAKNIIWTAGIGNPDYCQITLPLLQAYADQIGAELRVIKGTSRSNPQHAFLDALCDSVHTDVERHIWMDADIFPNKQIIDLFAEFDEEHMWAATDCGGHIDRMERWFRLLKFDSPIDPYHNTGVVIWNKQHAYALIKAGALKNWPPVGDQEVFAYLWRKAEMEIKFIPKHVVCFQFDHEIDHSGFVHYIGPNKLPKIEKRIAQHGSAING